MRVGRASALLGIVAVTACSGTTLQLRAGVPSSAPPQATASTGRAVHTVFGRSWQGQPLDEYRIGRPTAAFRVLVVGVIHGDEAAGLSVVRELLRSSTIGPQSELVLVPDVNPDGVARGTRQNARHVDLNRNFPFQWKPIGRPGDQQYSGAAALSEPEAKAMAALIRAVRPTVTVWFHQPVGVVDQSGGSESVERRFAQLLGLPLKRMTRYPGSAASWQNATWPGTTAFVVELPRTVPQALTARAANAIRDLTRR